MKQAAHWLSIALHPVFMPVLTLWLALRIDPHLGYFLTDEARWLVLGMIAAMTVVFPLASTGLLYRAGVISSLEMPHRAERIGPYIMTLLYYLMTWYLLFRSPLHEAILALFTGAALALAITLAITLRWKISTHMVGIGGLVGALAGLEGLHHLGILHELAAAIVLSGLLGSARLLSSDHSLGQVIAGVLLGAFCTYTSVTFGIAG